MSHLLDRYKQVLDIKGISTSKYCSKKLKRRMRSYFLDQTVIEKQNDPSKPELIYSRQTRWKHQSLSSPVKILKLMRTQDRIWNRIKLPFVPSSLDNKKWHQTVQRYFNQAIVCRRCVHREGQVSKTRKPLQFSFRGYLKARWMDLLLSLRKEDA